MYSSRAALLPARPLLTHRSVYLCTIDYLLSANSVGHSVHYYSSTVLTKNPYPARTPYQSVQRSALRAAFQSANTRRPRRRPRPTNDDWPDARRGRARATVRVLVGRNVRACAYRATPIRSAGRVCIVPAQQQIVGHRACYILCTHSATSYTRSRTCLYSVHSCRSSRCRLAASRCGRRMAIASG